MSYIEGCSCITRGLWVKEWVLFAHLDNFFSFLSFSLLHSMVSSTGDDVGWLFSLLPFSCALLLVS